MFVISGLARHRYDDSGFGVFYGKVNAQFLGAESIFFLDVRGETKPRWHWIRPENYRYETLEIEWTTERTKGKGSLRLPSLLLSNDDSSVELTEDRLGSLLLGSAAEGVSDKDREAVRQMRSFLTAAGDGTIPHPRHHSYHIEEPARAVFTHFSLGFRIPYAMYAWVAVWFILFVLGLIRSNENTESRIE